MIDVKKKVTALQRKMVQRTALQMKMVQRKTEKLTMERVTMVKPITATTVTTQ